MLTVTNAPTTFDRSVVSEPMTSVIRRLDEPAMRREPPELVSPNSNMIHLNYGTFGDALVRSIAEAVWLRFGSEFAELNVYGISERLGVILNSGPMKMQRDAVVHVDASVVRVIVDSERVDVGTEAGLATISGDLFRAIGAAVLRQLGILDGIGSGDLTTRLGRLVAISDAEVAEIFGEPRRLPFFERLDSLDSLVPDLAAARDKLAERFAIDPYCAVNRICTWLEHELGDDDIHLPQLELTDEMIAAEVGEPFVVLCHSVDDGATIARLDSHVAALVERVQARDEQEVIDAVVQWLESKLEHAYFVYDPGEDYPDDAVPPPNDPWTATRSPAISMFFRERFAAMPTGRLSDFAVAACDGLVDKRVLAFVSDDDVYRKIVGNAYLAQVFTVEDLRKVDGHDQTRLAEKVGRIFMEEAAHRPSPADSSPMDDSPSTSRKLDS